MNLNPDQVKSTIAVAVSHHNQMIIRRGQWQGDRVDQKHTASVRKMAERFCALVNDGSIYIDTTYQDQSDLVYGRIGWIRYRFMPRADIETLIIKLNNYVFLKLLANKPS